MSERSRKLVLFGLEVPISPKGKERTMVAIDHSLDLSTDAFYMIAGG